MGQPFVGEIRMAGFNFAPVNWAMCAGQLLPISENDTLFNLIGTTFGGDGQSTFALPDLRGRFPVHQGLGPGLSSRVIGEKSGSPTASVNLQATNRVTGSGSAAYVATSNSIPVQSPYLTITMIISLFGIFPSQN